MAANPLVDQLRIIERRMLRRSFPLVSPIERDSEMKITKHFDTLQDAVAYQTILYGKYIHVQLVRFPRVTESGTYQWEVNMGFILMDDEIDARQRDADRADKRMGW